MGDTMRAEREQAPPSPSRFLDDMAAQASSDSGLLIAASGLGVHVVFSKLCKKVTEDGIPGLVLSLNATVECENFVEDWMVQHSDPSRLPARIPVGTLPKVREQIYQTSRVCSASSRHLVVDILSNRLKAEQVRGCLVWNAHMIDVDSPVSFILRMLREKKAADSDNFFVRCLTDAPDAFAKRGLKLQYLLRNLTVQKVWLWPRFHIQADACLKQSLLEVVEMQGSLPKSVSIIQKNIIEIVEWVLAELRLRLEKFLPAGAGSAELTATGVISGQINRFLRSELGNRLDKLPKDVLTLIEELDTLRKLLRALHSKTSIEFYETVERAVFKAEGRTVNGIVILPSFWLHAGGTKHLLPHAKSRIVKNDVINFERESNFSTLTSVMKDIHSDWRKKGAGFSSLCPERTFMGRDRPTALVLCKDRHTQIVVSQMIHRGEAFVLNYMMKRYVANTYRERRTLAAALKEYHPKKLSDFDSDAATAEDGPPLLQRNSVSRSVLANIADNQQKTPIPDGALDVTEEDLGDDDIFSLIASVPCMHLPATATPSSPGDSTQEPGTLPFNPQQLDATQLEAGELEELRGLHFDLQSDDDSDISGDLLEAEVNVAPTQPLTGQLKGEPARKKRRLSLPIDPSVGGAGTVVQKPGCKTTPRSTEQAILSAEYEHYFGIFGAGSGPCAVVHTHLNSANLLDTLKPTWIVMYDPSVALIRSLEVYAARHSEWRTKVYVLGHADSTEQQRNLTDIKNETAAFKNLARERAGLATYVTNYTNDPSAQVAAPRSRRAGGLLQSLSRGSRVLVDLREFRSRLPSALHRANLVPVPMHLEIADYVLTADIGVERKSIPDLMGSLASGRLLQQIERLAKRYAIPVLLIEFDPDRQFCLAEGVTWHPGRTVFTQRENSGWFGATATPEEKTRAVLEKLASLVMLHPTLRIWWSRSPAMTASIFEKAKFGRPEPEEGDTAEAVDHASTAVDFLLKLPGVTQSNVGVLVDTFDTIADLLEAPRDRLAVLLGEEGLRLHTALHSS